ncbi:MAG: polysaccharide pyruvyl transferase family protein [Opitutaceae bacterium]|nr:polysaccharide pyruvyl transferase family protein [Opitutaceae bacterium]
MRIHLGHHFYGAGNLGDDFMLAGFLSAMRALAPEATFTCCVPFGLEPLRQRFPTVEWSPLEDADRARCIAECDVWLGLGGAPFQSALSRWFLDHLVGEMELCERARKPMFYLGIGIQHAADLAEADVRHLVGRAEHIWTRDFGSAEKLRALPSRPQIDAAADLAHIFFRDHNPPPAKAKRLTLVANFDYDAWPGQADCLSAIRDIPATERVWLAQEGRELPGAERRLYATLPTTEKAWWAFASPEQPGAPLPEVITTWPSGEWIVTARYHSAVAAAWAGSKIVVISTNEKLRSVAHDLHAPLLPLRADEGTVFRAISGAKPSKPPVHLADRARAACAEFVRSAVAHRR